LLISIIRLVERQLCLKRNGKPSDPVLPALCEPVVSPSLLREILEDVPIKVNMYPKQLEQAKGSFIAYAQACIRVASDDSKGQVIPEDKKARIIAYCKQALEWVYEQQSCEEVMKRLVGMRRDCGKELQRKMRSTVEEVCAQIARCSEEQSKLLEGEIGKLREWVQANKGMSTERVLHKLVKVNNLSNGQIHVEVGGLHSQLQEEYYHKLEELYRHWLGSRGFSRSDFHIHLARMLLRYNSVCGYEGANLHAAVPTAVFEVLTREFGVQMECFASPLNCYYPQFCSAYPDTDQAFGSCGSFLEFNPTKGSFQANPPFTEEMLLAMTQHMERLLAAASEELSFIVIVSDWQDSEGVVAMMNSRFKRGDLVLEAREHGYLNGAQHTMPAVQRKCSTAHASRIVVLQNDAAFARWTPTTERLSALRIAFSQ
jgi:phosphorylated CTD-interacting factor 1